MGKKRKSLTPHQWKLEDGKIRKRDPSEDSADQVPSSIKLVEVKDGNSMNKQLYQRYKTTELPPDATTPLQAQGRNDKDPRKVRRARGEESSSKRAKVEADEGEIVPLAGGIGYKDLGGIEKVLVDIRELVERPLLHPEIYRHLGVDPPRGILLVGPPGTGKTMLAHVIANETGVPFLSISGPEIVSGMSGESEQKIRELFAQASANAPSIIFIDEIDSITGKRENSQREMEKRIVAQLLTCIDELAPENNRNQAPVLILGATNRPDALDPALRRAGRFDREISLGVPDQSARLRILKVLLAKLRVSGDFDFDQLAEATPGFVGADLKALTKEAAVVAVNRIFLVLEDDKERAREREPTPPPLLPPSTPLPALTPAQSALPPVSLTPSPLPLPSPSLPRTPRPASHPEDDRHRIAAALKDRSEPLTEEQLAPLSITMADFLTALPHVQPSALREGFATIPNVTFDDVGALDEIRTELNHAVLEPIRSPHRFAAYNLSQPVGVLLYGPPGCGKTLLAKAIANECRANFISVKGPELLNKYVGESERAVRQVFSRAAASRPCIIFFDELDALCPKREGGDSNLASERVVNTLLTEMDGVDGRKDVFVLGATNRPDMIDPAMLRPGRLDKPLYVPLPSELDRLAILKTVSRHTPLAGDLQLATVAHKTEHFSGADLASLLKEACIVAMHEDDLLVTPVANRHFDIALTKVHPSVRPGDEKRYERMAAELRGHY